MARLFISYNRRDADYAYAVRQWLIDKQGWAGEDIFFDASHLHTGVDWEKKLLAEAEAAEVMLFLASEHSLNIDSFCYRELKHATGQIIAVTIKGISFSDERLDRALPHYAKSRQVTALDQDPTENFPFVSPQDNTPGSVRINRDRLEGIGLTLRELGVSPNSFTWTLVPTGPFPGLRPLMEGDEAIFCGRDLEIRDGLKAIEDLRATVTKRALIIQAPSGAGKSSFLRAGLWRRLRRNPGFTPLAIIRAQNGVLNHPEWGLIAGLADALSRDSDLGKKLQLSGDDIAFRATSDLPGLLAAFADADQGEAGRRTLLLGIDQAEEMASLSPENDAELDRLLEGLLHLPGDLDLRLILTARDDSVDATLERLARSGMAQDRVAAWRLHRLPASRFDEIINGPAVAANHAGWKLTIDPGLVDALVVAAGSGGEGGDALPILALALQRMVAKRRTPDGRITLEPKEAAAFLERAVSDATADALLAAKANAEELRRLIIPRLATWDPRAGAEGAAKRQVTAAADLFSGERAGLKPLADALVAQRLLTRTGDAYEVAHEALLRVPPLGGLIFACREKFEQARILEIEARDWMVSGKTTGNLARSGARLEDAFALLQDPDFGTDLRERRIEGTKVADYLGACRDHQTELLRQQEERRRKLIHDAWRNEGVGLLFRAEIAEERGHQYPDTLFHAARAIGFDGFGRPAMAGSEDDDRFPVLLHPDPERDPKNHAKARRWIATRPTYLPIWHSAPGAAPVTSVAWSPDGRLLGASFEDGSIRIWDIASDQDGWLCPPGAQSGAIRSLALSPDGRIWLAAGADGTLRRWDAYASYAELAPLEGNTGTVASVTFSPDGAWIAGASLDGAVRLWNAESGEPGATIKGHGEACHAVAFSPDNTTLASASADGTVKVWDVASGSGRFCLEEPGTIFLGVAFSPDGRFLAGASDDGAIRLWDAASAELEHTVTGVARADGVQNRPAQFQIAFRPDGTVLAAASPLGTIRLWSLAGTRKGAPELVATLTGQAGQASGVAFSPEGLILASGAADGTVRLWDVAGKPADPGGGPDLFTCFQDGWYRFDEDQEAVWGNDGGGERPAAIGFCEPNLRSASLPGIWRAPSLDDPQRQRLVFDRLLATGNWTGASLALARLGHPEDAAGQLARVVAADATGAGARGAVSLARSRIRIVRGMGDLPVPVREAVAGAERRVYPSLDGGNDFTNVLGTQLVWCRPGTFRLGEKLERQVTLTTGFWLGRFPVTQAEWVALMGNNPSSNRVSGLRVPVEQVSWKDAMEFCQRLTEREVAAGAMPQGWGYSLPTEAMWEYACRAGTTTSYSFGDDEAQLGDYAWFDKNSEGKTHPVGLKKPNPWGFHDMHGNVWEWCADWYEEKPGTDPITDPTGRASGGARVNRGGSWFDFAGICRSAYRSGNSPDFRLNSLGVRLAAVPISSIPPEASSPGTASGR